MTIGHVDRYTTHTLLPAEGLSENAVPRKDAQPCTCPYADDIKKITAEKILQERKERNESVLSLGERRRQKHLLGSARMAKRLSSSISMARLQARFGS